MKKLAWLLLWVMAWAACNAQQDEAAAPVRTARLTYFAGAVQVERSDNTGVDEPVMNLPVGEGTRLVCGDYGQAELEFEDGSVVRVTPRSSIAVDRLEIDGGVARTGISVLGGLVYFELRKSPGYSFAVSAGGVGMAPLENTLVRVSLGDGPAVFSVLSGSVRVDRGFTAEVRAGESLHADAKDDARYFLNQQIAAESWDAWNEDRDRAAADETEKRTAARDDFAGVQGYGWSDLDANGTWYDVPGEGQVWQPDVADEGFDPYGFGSWAWQGVGYVWASGYTWGWTPFRCGHWDFYPGFGWGWVPDRRCGRWGSGGGAVLIGTRSPSHYKEVPVPLKGPVKVHPIIIVRGPNGPRPPVLTGGEKQVRGLVWTPLVRVGGVARTGPALGLSRDYPVDGTTHLPVMGKVPKEEGVIAGNPAGVANGWQRVKPEPTAVAPPRRQGSAGTSATAPAAAPSAPSTRTTQEPPRSSAPVQAPPRTVMPVQAPVAQRPAPAPAPAPVYHAPPAPPPPPPPPPPAAAPARTDTSKPK